MQEYSPEQLAQIEEFASLYLSKKEIALVMNIPDPSMLGDEDTKVGKAFLKGRIMRKAQFHRNITALSDQLSSPAQAIESKLAESTFLNDSKS
jgi:hypothetical protein